MDEDLERCTLYGIAYDIQESSKNIPTYTESIVGDAIPINGYYTCKVELLFSAGENYTRRIVIPVQTVNLTFLDILSDIREQLEILYDSQCCGYKELNTLIQRVKDEFNEDVQQIVMFDTFGQAANIDIDSKTNFLAMLISARMLSITFTDTTKTK